jgi:dienelactone hydrolase
MFRRIGAIVVLALSVVFATVALLLVRPQPMVEFFAGFVGGSLWIFQLAFAAIALLLAGLSLWLERTPARWTRLARTGVVVVLVGAALATAWRELASYSRRAERIPVDGTARIGTLYVPRDGAGERRPAVVVIHGSGSVKRNAYHFLARRFAERGFVVLNMDKRGVGDSPGRYFGDDLDDGRVIATRVRETRAALEHLRMLPGVDSAKVGLVTISQGGWVMSSLLDGSSPARFAINISGPAVSTREEAAWSKWTDELRDHFGLTPPPVPFDVLEQRVKAIAPAGFDPRANLAAMTLPSLWLYGEWDSSLPAKASTEYLESLRVSGRPITWRMFPEANHGLFVVRGPNGSRLARFAPGVWDTVFAWTSREGITRAAR